ncbi:phosphoribosyltransferase [Dehalococcoides mccartyi]|uniref:Phosphoribosyltransferase-like protein n=1 Tax=Dehalococcoides mccartyi (strain VS) TaxID=311424 RepID=D2BHW3_DEHMV|nr:phosphoribosyltransferase family protein [Dehalococcoides mccartyi]ACZ61913.1 phosphoribosyltransferase-like protein [Dehalococcoides mccartyi VS]
MLKIVSHDHSSFTDRYEAGAFLAIELGNLKGKQAVVLGIPRGGVVIASQIADRLRDARLDIILSRKLRAPSNPELAIGSMSENGQTYLNPHLIHQLEIPLEYVHKEAEFQLDELKRQARVYREVIPRIPLNNHLVIITDDGIATGSTFEAALTSVRQECPAYLIAAIPVGPESTLRRLEHLADEVICLKCPEKFESVGQHYYYFTQVDDDNVLNILKRFRHIL